MRPWVVLLVVVLAGVSVQATIINVPGDQPTIQAGIDIAIDNDTVLVAAGTYVEQLRIDAKSITLLGAGIGQSIIEAVPLVDRTRYQITQWNATTREVDACIGVTECEEVQIAGFTIDGLGLGPNEFYGIHFFNSNGSVAECRLTRITDAANPGYGNIVSLVATHGAAGGCAVEFSDNEVPEFQKCGVLVMGPSASFVIESNTVVGGGATTVAQNGMQLSYGATGTLLNNDVTSVYYPGPDWAGTGILLFESGDVTITGGQLLGCQTAIGHSQWNWIYTPPTTPTIVVNGVTLDLNQWAVETHLGEDGVSLNLEVANCTISGTANAGVELWGSGIDPWGGSYYTGWINGSLSAQIHDNIIIDGWAGVVENVEIPTGNVVTCMVNHNDLGGNAPYGVYNNFTNMIDATANWWGDPSGPDMAMYKAGVATITHVPASPFSAVGEKVPTVRAVARQSTAAGTGSAVTPNVDYSPWWGGNYKGDPHTSPWDWGVDPSNGSTIQEGIEMATAGDAVHIAGATYEEQVVVAKDLALVGAGPEFTIIQSPVELTAYFTTSADNYPVLYTHDATVNVQGLTVDGLARGNSNYRFVGVGYWNAEGTISDVRITGVRDTPLSGSQHGIGLYAFNSDGAPRFVNMQNVSIDDFQKGGLVANGAGLQATLSQCSVTGAGPIAVTAQNGIQIGFDAVGSLSDCTVADVAYTGSGWGASGFLFYWSGYSSLTGASLATGCQSGIVFHESSGEVSGATVTGSGLQAEEGVSVRAYISQAALASEGNSRRAVAFDEGGITAPSVKAAVSVVSLSGLTLTGTDAPGSRGVVVWAEGENASATVALSDIQHWETGLLAYEEQHALGWLTVDHTRIYNNGFGFFTSTGGIQNAEHNYWGSNHGPTHASNPNGDGDAVGDAVDFIPWCNYDFTICDLEVTCCLDRVGDPNGVGGDEPTIGDVSMLIDHLFISQAPLNCYPEADIDQSGSYHPVSDDITVGDISTLIDYLFITGPSLGLPDCL